MPGISFIFYGCHIVAVEQEYTSKAFCLSSKRGELIYKWAAALNAVDTCTYILNRKMDKIVHKKS